MFSSIASVDSSFASTFLLFLVQFVAQVGKCLGWDYLVPCPVESWKSLVLGTLLCPCGGRSSDWSHWGGIKKTKNKQINLSPFGSHPLSIEIQETPSAFPLGQFDHLHGLPLDPLQSVCISDLWGPELDAVLQAQPDKCWVGGWSRLSLLVMPLQMQAQDPVCLCGSSACGIMFSLSTRTPHQISACTGLFYLKCRTLHLSS